MYKVTFRRVRVTIVAVESSGVQIALFLRCVMLSAVAPLSLADS
jgi:hypothetical protein